MRQIIGGILWGLIAIAGLGYFITARIAAVDYRLLAQYSDSCGSGWSCKTLAGTACLNAGGDSVGCTSSSGAAGSCCVPPAPTNTPVPPTATPKPPTPTIYCEGMDNNVCNNGSTYCKNDCLDDGTTRANVYCSTNYYCSTTAKVYCNIVYGLDVGPVYCPQAGPSPTSYCHPLTCTNTCGLGGCPATGGCGNIDNCGGVDCTNCDGSAPGGAPAPTASGCTPNCACASTTCSNKTCVNNCGGYCYGTVASTAPTAPNLLAPIDGGLVKAGSIPFNWNPPSTWGQCPGTSLAYDWCVGTTSPPSACLSLATTGTGTYTYNGYSQLTPGIYYWRVGANNGAVPSVFSATRSFVVDTAPVVNSVIITNSIGTTVAAEAGSRNQICQLPFASSGSPRQVRFIINAADVNGGTDITAMNITWNGKTFPAVLQAASGNNRTGIVDVNFAAGDNNGNTFALNAVATDSVGSTGVNASRSFKVWDCTVPVSGNMYDSSDRPFGAVCSTGSGFTNLANISMNFNSVGADDRTGAPAVSVSSTLPDKNAYVGLNLIWGKAYTVGPNSDLSASGIVSRWVDLGAGTTSCSSDTLDQTTVDAYRPSPALKIDFSAMSNQQPWFQAAGGGVFATSSIANMVPVTCAMNFACKPAMSINWSMADNGLVAGSSISNDSGCPISGSTPQCFYGSPNNWSISKNVLTSADKYDYDYFYNKYFSTLGLGTTVAGNATMSQINAIGGTGVVLVSGNLTVDTDNSLAVGKYLMVIVKGTITFDQGVTAASGIFMADGGITAGGVGTAGLVIEGSLYSSGANIRLNRDFVSKIDNNTNPSVTVNYRPDFLFNLPSSMLKVLSEWKQL